MKATLTAIADVLILEPRVLLRGACCGQPCRKHKDKRPLEGPPAWD